MSAARDDGGHILQAFMVDRLGGENVTVDGSVNESAAIPAGTKVVYLCSDADCYVTRGATGITVAASNGHFLPAGAILPYPVEDGEVIACIQKDAATGLLNVARARRG